MSNKSGFGIWYVGLPVEGRGDRWMVEGAFLEEADAVASSRRGEFVLFASINSRLPIEAIDAEKIYYPCNGETWETSVLYNIRKNKKT